MTSSGTKLRINVAAYHEAGHALAALKENRRVSLIIAFHQLPGKGICFFARNPTNPYNITFNLGNAKAAWEHTFKTTCSDIRIALAGPLAEAKVLGKPLRSLGGRSDLDRCIHQIERLHKLGFHVSRNTEYQPYIPKNILSVERRKVRQWLAHPNVWRVVIQIANKLSEKGHLSEENIGEQIGLVTSPRRQSTLSFSSKFINKKEPKTVNTSGPDSPYVNERITSMGLPSTDAYLPTTAALSSTPIQKLVMVV